ncbi:LacI family DNA-binding transcriptional regulator [Shinella pollutisoli]|uniref:LacI family DNA-binding transcriptional regulator n=1 Tax=Shinella pollutisoli TaxID=2250594 RepID=A0ABV7DEY3_9HYPH|nr:LacI family DNA-binding transcriptional regulator [Shinella pollutisoli]
MKKNNPSDPSGGQLRKKYASSMDVARLAGVSQSAVSRTFTEGASVSPKTRAKVMKAADELGYGPSIIPRIMLTHRSSLIAIVSGGLYNPFYASVVEALAQAIQKSGSNVMFFSVNHGEYIDEIIPDILGYRVDGIISALSIVSPEAAERCAKMHTPVVLFNNKLSNEWVASICSDNVEGGRQIASLFLKRGGKRFAYIGGKKGNLASEDRFAGYLAGLMREGVTDVAVTYGDFRHDEGYEAARKLLAAKRPPDAIFCANDLMALGAMEAAKAAGLRIPEDVLIAGFDDIPAASWPSFDLTTIRQDGDAMIRRAMDLLSKMIDGEQLAGNSLHLIAAPLVERGSTARAVPAG